MLDNLKNIIENYGHELKEYLHRNYLLEFSTLLYASYSRIYYVLSIF